MAPCLASRRRSNPTRIYLAGLVHNPQQGNRMQHLPPPRSPVATSLAVLEADRRLAHNPLRPHKQAQQLHQAVLAASH